jgi:hypothetical protein
MTTPAIVATAVAGALAIAAVTLFLVKEGMIPGFKRLQVTGDPPVTVGDGSLHARSQNGWVKNGNGGDATIEPKSKGGGQATLHPGCGLAVDSKTVSALLWTDDDKLYDISPNGAVFNATITHDSDNVSNGGDPAIEITIPSVGYPLTITTKDGTFEKAKDAKGRGAGNRQHSRPGQVEKVVVSAGSTSITWDPKTIKQYNPHYTLAFCYE